MKAINISHELLRKENPQPKRAGVGIQNVNATFDCWASRGARKKGLIKQGAGRMQSHAGHENAAGDLRQLGENGNR